MSRGGIYNCATVNYSPETCSILKALLAESKLSISTQKKINNSILSGVPLPKPRAKSAPPQPNNLFGFKKNYYFAKRTQRQIRESGAYEFEQIRNFKPIIDRCKEKEQLQNQMAFGNKKGEVKAEFKAKARKPLTRQERTNELLAEIQDRVQFLECMEQLGQAHKYERDIKQEMAAKLRELKDLQRITDSDFTSIQKSF